MTIKIDSSPITHLVWCSECWTFAELYFTKPEAHECAVRHEKALHPGVTVAQSAAAMFRLRHPECYNSAG